MTTMTDARDEDRRWLNEFARDGSHAAFEAIVKRYVDLVYAVALRRTRGDAHLANDITQGVFIVLARRAGSISRSTLLPGWLHRTTCYAAANARVGRSSSGARIGSTNTVGIDRSSTCELRTGRPTLKGKIRSRTVGHGRTQGRASSDHLHAVRSRSSPR